MMGARVVGTEFGLIEDEFLAFFQFIYTIYKKAERTAGHYVERYFNIGDCPVRLRFAGDGLAASITPAIAHLEIEPTTSPVLTILLWDSISTGSEIPSVFSHYLNHLGEWWDHLTTRGEVKELTSERIRTAYHLGPNIFSILDTQENLALYWVRDGQALPYYEKGSPLRTILNWWLEGDTYQFVHGGAVGIHSGGVLIAGKGGSGKSTTALACLQGGLLYASDDYCLIRVKPDPHVYSVYNTAKLQGEADLLRFPRLAPMINNIERADDEKAMIFLHEYFPQNVSSGFPIKAILVPTITNNIKTRLKPATAGTILAALAPSTLFQLPGAGLTSIKTMSKLVKNVPGYVLELGSDVSMIPEVILDLLSSVAPNESAID